MQGSCNAKSEAIGYKLVRRVLATLFFLALVLVLGLRAVLPALPVYVCYEMGGEHVLGPCCESEEVHPGDAPSYAARCCVPEKQPTVEAQRAPQPQATLLASVVVAVAGVFEFASPPSVPTFRLPPLCNGPPPLGPPPLHRVLRI